MREGVNPREKSNKRSISEGQWTPESMGFLLLSGGLHTRQSLFFVNGEQEIGWL